MVANNTALIQGHGGGCVGGGSKRTSSIWRQGAGRRPIAYVSTKLLRRMTCRPAQSDFHPSQGEVSPGGKNSTICWFTFFLLQGALECLSDRDGVKTHKIGRLFLLTSF